MDFHIVMRESFEDELQKIAEAKKKQVATRYRMSQANDFDPFNADVGSSITGANSGAAPSVYLDKAASGVMDTKKEDVADRDEPSARRTGSGAKGSSGSYGGGTMEVPKQQYKNAPRPQVSPAVTLEQISTGIHPDDRFASSSK